MNLVRYHGTGEWSALYVDGKLKVVGDHYHTDEAIAQIAGVVGYYDNDDFMRGGNNYESVAANLDELNEFAADRVAREAIAKSLREQADQLIAQAKELERGTS